MPSSKSFGRWTKEHDPLTEIQELTVSRLAASTAPSKVRRVAKALGAAEHLLGPQLERGTLDLDEILKSVYPVH